MSPLLLLVRELIKEALSFDNNKTFTPPHNVIMAAKTAMSSSSAVGYGGNKGNGKEKAMELASGAPQSFDQMRRLKSYFETEKERTSVNATAWDLHGGDAARAWVNREMERINSGNMRSKKTARVLGGAGKNKGMGTMNMKMMDPTNTRTRSAWSGMKNREQNS